MASVGNPTECGVCNEEFNEESKCPRTLPCSHHLCSECINKLIAKNSKLCPFCRKPFVANSAKDIMINHALVDCVKYISFQKSTSPATSLGSSSAYHQKIVEFKNVASKGNGDALNNIRELKKQAEKSIGNAMELKECKEKTLPKLLSIIADIEKKSESLGPSTQKLQKHVEAIEEKEKFLISAKSKLDSAKSFQSVAAIMDETEETSIAVNEWSENLKRSLAEEDTVIQSIKKDISMSTKLKEGFMEGLGIAVQERAVHPLTNTQVTVKQQELPNNISGFDLWQMRPPVRYLIEQGRLYAKKNTKIGKITIENNKLHIYCLEHERETVPNRCYVKYEDVMTLVKSEVPVFLDVSVRGSNMGRIHILLNRQAPVTLPIHLTGGNNCSYRDHPFKVLDKGSLLEQIVCGGTFSPIVINGYKRNFNDFSLRCLQGPCRSSSGSVELLSSSTSPPLFAIRTGPYGMNSGNESYSSRKENLIGVVTDDLDALREASRQVDDINDIKISNCGVVLSTELPIE